MSKKELIEYIDNFDLETELKALKAEEVKKMIEEEWDELIKAGIGIKETISIITDAHYKWMKLNKEHELFVHQTLRQLNNQDDEAK